MDKRNSLFWEFLRAVNELEPRSILFENVPGFKGMYGGKVFDLLLKELDKIGYNVFSDVLDAANYGLPQNRKRTIVIGIEKGKSFSFPKVTHNLKESFFEKKYLNIMEAISDLPNLRSGEAKSSYLHKPQNEYQKKLRGNEKKLTEHNATNYGIKMKKILKLIPKKGSIKDLPKYLRPKKYFNNVYARLDEKKPSPTLTRNFGTPSSSRCIHPYQDRALSTREGARIQGFPDSYKFFGSKTSKNLQIGNAVPPLLGEVIVHEIKKTLT